MYDSGRGYFGRTGGWDGWPQELPSTSRRLAHALYCNVLPHACRDRPDDPRNWADAPEIRCVVSGQLHSSSWGPETAGPVSRDS